MITQLPSICAPVRKHCDVGVHAVLGGKQKAALMSFSPLHVRPHVSRSMDGKVTLYAVRSGTEMFKCPSQQPVCQPEEVSSDVTYDERMKATELVDVARQ